MLVLAAVLVALVVGPLIERGLLRFCYGKDEVVLVLVTYALFLILEDLVKLVWGVESYFVSEPYGLLGNRRARTALLPGLQRRHGGDGGGW